MDNLIMNTVAPCGFALLGVISLANMIVMIVGLAKEGGADSTCPKSNLFFLAVVMIPVEVLVSCLVAPFGLLGLGIVATLLSTLFGPWALVEAFHNACTHSGLLWTSVAISGFLDVIFITAVYGTLGYWHICEWLRPKVRQSTVPNPLASTIATTTVQTQSIV